MFVVRTINIDDETKFKAFEHRQAANDYHERVTSMVVLGEANGSALFECDFDDVRAAVAAVREGDKHHARLVDLYPIPFSLNLDDLF